MPRNLPAPKLRYGRYSTPINQLNIRVKPYETAHCANTIEWSPKEKRSNKQFTEWSALIKELDQNSLISELIRTSLIALFITLKLFISGYENIVSSLIESGTLGVLSLWTKTSTEPEFSLDLHWTTLNSLWYMY